VLGDPAIDLIVIATRHHEHADQVVRAIAAGKHVFVEKPLALTWDELARVAQVYTSPPNAPLLKPPAPAPLATVVPFCAVDGAVTMITSCTASAAASGA